MEENTYGTEYYEDLPIDNIVASSGDFVIGDYELTNHHTITSFNMPQGYRIDFTKCKSVEELAKVISIVMDNLNLQVNESMTGFSEIKEYLEEL